MYKITLPINLDGDRYGIKFFKGVGETDDEKIVTRMKDKGFGVEPVKKAKKTGESSKSPAKYDSETGHWNEMDSIEADGTSGMPLPESEG